MPDLGIGEGLAALFGGGDILAGLFGGSEAAAAGLGAGAAAAPAFETGLATIGGLEGVGAGAGGLADIVGTGAGLAGGTTGLAGTALAGGAGDIAGLLGAGGGTALGTAEAFMGAPGASGFNAGAITPSAFGGATSVSPSAGLSPSVANANASMGGGSSVFDTGTAAVPGVGPSGAPSAGGASAIAAPSGVTAPIDATAASGAAAGGAPATGAGTSSSISDLLSKAGSGAMKSLTSNPLGIALGAGGLGYNILQGQKNTANQKALTADAQQATANSNKMMASGEALQQYLASGTLPAGYQSQVDQAIEAAKTTAISNAAQQGQNTDPTQNTALAAELAKIDASKPAMQSQVASQLFSSGSSLVSAGQGAAGLSGQLYQALVQNDTAAAANTGKAIATLAAAMNGRSQATLGGTNISVSQG